MITLTDLRQEMDVPVVIADNQGFVTYINPCFTAVLGWESADLIGQLLTSILPPSFQDSHNLAFSRFQATEQATVLNHPIRLKTICKDQSEIDTEHFIVAQQQDGQWHFGARLRPLSPDADAPPIANQVTWH
ncbi:MAG: PAS domain S-box protein [Alkalinema sp. RL_2_19]|nr:PAS domain S-box protein [Alkalinema sp. RL_2_19]